MDVRLALLVAIGLLAGLAVPRPAGPRGSAVVGGVAAAAWVRVGTALAIVAPWGRTASST